MILVIDNYDSFTYNLVDMLRPFDDVRVLYPDDASLFDLNPDGVVISPGPGHPNDSDDLHRIIQSFEHIPILGICLGAQALYCYYGGDVNVAQKVMTVKLISYLLMHRALYTTGFQNILTLCATIH